MSLEFHVAGISNVAGGTLAGHVPGLEICGILVANATAINAWFLYNVCNAIGS